MRGRPWQLLCKIIGAGPAAIAFGLVENGRPFILGDGYVAPSFNVSHTDKYGLLAASGEFQIGLEIEAVRLTKITSCLGAFAGRARPA